MNHVRHHLRSADISIFSTDIGKFSYIKKYRYRLHYDIKLLIFKILFESIKDSFNKHDDDVAKMATLGLLKIKVFSKKVMMS